MSSVILLVDDNPIQAATRKAILERAGHSILVAQDGRSAIELLSNPQIPHTFGLVITDHIMPGMNGTDLVRSLRSMGFDLPILVLSGMPDVESHYAGLNVVFRLKPLHPEALIQLTNQLLCQQMPRTA